MSVYKSLFNRSIKAGVFQRTPATFIQYIIFGNGIRFIGIYQYQIGKVSLSYKPSFLYLKTGSHSMTHLVNYFLNTYFPISYILQHQLQ